MLRVVTQNLNGIRSAARKGWLDWINSQDAHVVCVQEIKAQLDDLDDCMKSLGRARGHFHFAEKKGYSGVGLYAARKPKLLRIGFGSSEFDTEGRYIEADFGTYTVISLYVPSGSSSEERQRAKFIFMEQFKRHLLELRASGREIILCGDWNVAHKEIDLRNWRSNQKNSGFLPDERAWLTRVFDELGFVDVFRRVDVRAEQYTWWSNRGASWANNVGWRIDYQIATPGIAAKAHAAAIYRTRRFSDHAPLVVDYDYTLAA